MLASSISPVLGVPALPVFVLFTLLLFGGISAQEPAEAWPLTGAEREEWSRSTNYVEVIDYLGELVLATDRVALRRLALTDEGRVVPVVFLGDPPHDDPVGMDSTGNPTMLILGSIHGDEPAGREGSLQLIRSLALGEDARLLERVNVIVVPYLNPDGGEAGQRENSAGYDLNRDWIVAETPEVGAVLERLVNRFRPDVFLDAHNGGAYPYHLTYQATLDPAADGDLVAFARGPLFDAVRTHLRDLGMDAYWYSGASFDNEADAWYWGTTEPLPRKQHSYGGLRNMITLLFEVPGTRSLDVEALATLEGMRALAAFVAERGEDVRAVVEEAERRAVEEPAAEVFLALEPSVYPELEEFWITTGPGSRENPALVTGENRTLYQPVRTRPAPWGYVIDRTLVDVVSLLRRHDIEVMRMEEGAVLGVEEYRVTELTIPEEVYQNHSLLELEVELVESQPEFPAGTFVVPLAQAAGRLVPQLLEPDAVDSVVRWNFLDAILRIPPDPTAPLPIYRIHQPPSVATTQVL